MADTCLDASLLADMPEHIAVGWSGGVDSTALALLLKDAGKSVQLWHVDHGWHAASADIATALAQQAKAWGMPFLQRRIAKPRNNIEAEARKARYQAFVALAEETGCKHIALGHHLQDQAETVCMRLLQGAGVAGCQGMKPCRKHQALTVWRPLLSTPKSALIDVLQARRVLWHEDESNRDTTLWRNRIRHRLFPAMRAYGVEPDSLFLRLQKQAVRLQRQIAKQALVVPLRCWHEEKIAVCAVPWQAWLMQSLPLRVWLLQRMIGALFADGRVFGRRHILAIEAWAKQGGHGWLNLSGCCLYRHAQDLQLCQGKVSLRHSIEK